MYGDRKYSRELSYQVRETILCIQTHTLSIRQEELA